MILIRFIFTIALFYILYRVLRTYLAKGEKKEPEILRRDAAPMEEDLVEDPNCHIYIPQSQAFQATAGNRTLYFCSRKCCEDYMKSQKDQGET